MRDDPVTQAMVRDRQRELLAAGRISGPRSRHDERKRLLAEVEAAQREYRLYGGHGAEIRMLMAEDRLAEHDRRE